eukprot:Gb_19472 [translate_table: standard]
MFPQFASTAASFTRASTMVFRMGTDAHLYDDPQDANIDSLLDSKFDAEKVEALKRLLALMSQGCDVSNFFPQVVKNVASQSLEVKKLVYIYLVHYAERRPDEALLSINSFQKDLSDLNPLVRAWALRAMSGIRVHVVAPLVLMAVIKCARDPSPYVRRCAANAIPKLYDLDREQHNTALEELVGVLFNDNSAAVVGAAAAAFNAVCPDNLSLVGSNFKRLCETLPDVEEWGQIVLIEILLHYVVARHGISKTSAAFSSGYAKRLIIEMDHSDGSSEGLGMDHRVDTNKGSKGDYGHKLEENADFSSSFRNEPQNMFSSLSNDSSESNDASPAVELNSDLKLLLQCTSPLLWSRNSGVVLAAAGVHWLMAPMRDAKRIVKPLLFLLRSSYDSQYVVLANLATFVGAMPSFFEPYFEDFFVRSSDTYQMKAIKLDILSLIATESSIHTILQEFQDYIRDPDRKFAADTVAAIGRCARRLPTVSWTCLKGLLALVRHSSASSQGSDRPGNEETAGSRKEKFPGVKVDMVFRADWMLTSDKIDREAGVLTQAIIAIKAVLQQHPTELEKVFVHLVRSLDLIKVPAARAVVIWMVGEYSCIGNIPKIVPTILEYLGACFPTEGMESKLQILNCAAKVVSRSKVADPSSTISLLLNYVLDKGGCDLSYDVRDRARMLKKLLSSRLIVYGVDGRNDLSQTSQGGKHLVSAVLPGAGPSVAQEENCGDNSGKHVLSEASASQHDPHVNLFSALAKHVLLSPKLTPVLQSISLDRSFLPGSLSYIVQHTAPGYRPLPKPCSMLQTHIPHTAEIRQATISKGKERANSQDNSGNTSDYTYISSSGSYSGESLHGHVSGADQKSSASSNASESSEFEMKPRDRRRSSPTRSTRKAMVKSRSVDSKDKTSQHLEITDTARDQINAIAPLISLSDGEYGKDEVGRYYDYDGTIPQAGSNTSQLMSKDAFESWLGPHPPVLSKEDSIASGYAILSIGTVDVELRKYTLLDFTNGDGLNVMYAFSTELSSYSPMMICVRLFFDNRSSEAFSNIVVRAKSVQPLSESSFPTIEACDQSLVSSDTPTVIPMQEIPCLEPGQATEADLHVCFHHQLVPIKLGVFCNRKCYSVRLMPEIGALLRPLSMSAVAFTSKESQISGMLENSRRCIFREHFKRPRNVSDLHLQQDDKLVVIARNIASRILSRVHASLISVTIPIFASFAEQSAGNGDVQGLCLRFSGETLSKCIPCLITITAEGNHSGVAEVPVAVKINCEDTVFGLNLLKHLVDVLSEN